MSSKTAVIKAVVLGDVDNFKRGMTDAAQSADEAGGKISHDLNGALDSVGEGAGGAEQKFMGLADSIGGTQDVMQGLASGDISQVAMGMADLSGAVEALWSSVAKTVVSLWGKVTALAAEAAATGTSTAALIGHKIAMVASEVATKAMTAGQWLLNAAMSANPIMLVVIAIAALVAGFVLAYQHVGWFRDIVDATVGFIVDIAVPMFKQAGEWVAAAFAVMVDGAMVLWDVISTYVWPVLQTVAGWIGSYFTTQFDAARLAIGWVIDAFQWLADKVVSAHQTLVSTIDGMVASVSGIAGRILTAIGDFGSLLYNAGRDVISGLWNGISARWSEVAGKVAGIGSSVKNAIGGALGIGSPSTVMHGVGLDTMQGFHNGLQAGWKPVQSMLNAATRAVRAVAVDPSGGRNIVQWGQVSEGAWQQLLAAGWAGRAGDNMEALYRPMAEGALVRGGRGGVRGLVGEGASDELVVPLNRAGLSAAGMGTTINVTVNAPVGSSARDIGRELRRCLNEFDRAS